MTVAELIAELQRLDPSLPVIVPGSGAHEGAGVDARHVQLVRACKLSIEYCDPSAFAGNDDYPPRDAAWIGDADWHESR